MYKGCFNSFQKYSNFDLNKMVPAHWVVMELFAIKGIRFLDCNWKFSKMLKLGEKC